MSGRVKLMAYDRFIRAAGYVASAITLMLFLANQVIFFKKNIFFWESICTKCIFFITRLFPPVRPSGLRRGPTTLPRWPNLEAKVNSNFVFSNCEKYTGNAKRWKIISKHEKYTGSAKKWIKIVFSKCEQYIWETLKGNFKILFSSTRKKMGNF